MKRIAIVGPESTGKSDLAIRLSEALTTIYVPEIARDYINNLKEPYTEKDVLRMAMLQCAAEDEAELSKPEYLVYDTTMLVMKIWSEVKYKRVHPFILSQHRRRHYDLTLLMSIDLPWVDDPQREHPESRDFLFEEYRKNLEAGSAPFEIISGSGEERLLNAMTALRKHRILKRE